MATCSAGHHCHEWSCHSSIRMPHASLVQSKAGLRIVEGPGFMQLERFGLHEQHSHEILPPPQFNASLEDDDFSPAPSDPDDSDSEDDEVDDNDEDEDDDDDSVDDNRRDTGEGGQLSVDEGLLQKINVILYLRILELVLH